MSEHEHEGRGSAHQHAHGDHSERHVHLMYWENPVDGDTDDGHDHYVVDADADFLRIVQSLNFHFTRFPRKEHAEDEQKRWVEKIRTFNMHNRIVTQMNGLHFRLTYFHVTQYVTYTLACIVISLGPTRQWKH